MKYIAITEIKHNGKTYKVGQQIELTDNEANQIPYAIKKTPQANQTKNNNKNNQKKSEGAK